MGRQEDAFGVMISGVFFVNRQQSLVRLARFVVSIALPDLGLYILSCRIVAQSCPWTDDVGPCRVGRGPGAAPLGDTVE